MSRIPVSGVATQNVSPDELYDAIYGAASQDPSKVKASSERLKDMFDMTGTSDVLSQIAAQKTVPLQIRQQSIIQFKNTALNHWRSRRLVAHLSSHSVSGSDDFSKVDTGGASFPC